MKSFTKIIATNCKDSEPMRIPVSNGIAMDTNSLTFHTLTGEIDVRGWRTLWVFIALISITQYWPAAVLPRVSSRGRRQDQLTKLLLLLDAEVQNKRVKYWHAPPLLNMGQPVNASQWYRWTESQTIVWGRGLRESSVIESVQVGGVGPADLAALASELKGFPRTQAQGLSEPQETTLVQDLREDGPGLATLLLLQLGVPDFRPLPSRPDAVLT